MTYHVQILLPLFDRAALLLTQTSWVLPPLSVGKMTLRLYGALNYSHGLSKGPSFGTGRGAGSVGAIVAEGLVRMGVETVSLIDFDRVKEHNLDRLLHGTTADIGRLKVEVAAETLRKHATADNIDIRAYPHAVTREDGLKAALELRHIVQLR